MNGNRYIREFMDLDLYEYNVKKQRKGQAKIDARENQCKIFVNVNDVNLNEDEVLKAYLFKYDRGHMIAVPIGTLDVKNKIGQLKVTTVRERVMEGPYAIDDLSGLLIVKKNYFTKEAIRDTGYGGAWEKDIKINFDAFKEYQAVAENLPVHKETMDNKGLEARGEEEERTPIEEDKSEIIEVEENRVEEEDASIPKNQLIEEEPLIEEETLLSQEALEEIDSKEVLEEERVLEEANEKVLEKETLVIDHKAGQEVSEETERFSRAKALHTPVHARYKRTMYEYESNKRAVTQKADEVPLETSEKDHNSVLLEREERAPVLREGRTSPKNEFDEEDLKSLHLKMFSEYPKMAPFERCEDVIDCIRIEPKDIATMPISLWMLMNNTFLLNGYHKYKHLILCKVEDDTQAEGVRYLIGVPGIYHKKDRFISCLYGFNKFRCCANTYPKSGEYGYWMVDIGRM